MSQPTTGYIYALERRDLMAVYVGQTIRLPKRVKEHARGGKRTRPLYVDGVPTMVEVITAEPGNALDDLEKLTACQYEADGWNVLSRNTKHIWWNCLAKVDVSPEELSAARLKWWASRTPEQRAEQARRIRAGRQAQSPEERRKATVDWNASRTAEARSESARKREAALTPEERSDRSRRARASIDPERRSELARIAQQGLTREQQVEKARIMREKTTPEQRQEGGRVGGKKTASMRRRCLDCGLTTTPPSMAGHLKASHHSGYEPAGP